MTVRADDLIDWIADRQALLIAAWVPQIEANLAWEPPYAETLAFELHDAMVTTMLYEGREPEFLRYVSRRNTSVDRKFAEHFYGVTVSLARASSRHARDSRTNVLPFKRGIVVGDSRTDPTHLLLAEVLLPRNHDFWGRWHPPLGMECRCGTISMTQGQYERLGRSITTQARIQEIEGDLHDSWPKDFLPLLDFRKSLGPLPS